MRKQDSTRRQFLQRTGSLCATLPFLPMARAGSGLPRSNERALVLLELAGGNDGLNTVIPFEDDRYHRLRPTLRIAKDQVLTPEQFYRVYPRYRELLVIKRRLDPDGLFTSDLARRVGIDPVLNKQLPE